MNGVPEDDSLIPEDSGAEPEVHNSGPQNREPARMEAWPAQETAGESIAPYIEPVPAEPPVFQYIPQPVVRRPPRIPNFGHLMLFALMAVVGLVGASILVQTALHFHLFGVATAQDAMGDVHYTLGSEAIFYLFTFAACLVFFPLIWHEGFFAGLQWNGATALRLYRRLFVAAVICFLLALLNGYLLPGPTNAPIDKIFRAPGAAWWLFAFGVTFAPFFEEMIFRGFLLPSLCTACDWFVERTHGEPPPPLGEKGHPEWSFGAMVFASVFTSVPFALMHAAQTGYSVGPFVLLVFVSLVLCWARLSTRSLAASVMIHACYNFMLFSLMMLGTGGFRNLQRM